MTSRTRFHEPIPFMNTFQIFRKSIRFFLLQPTLFNSAAVFLFSPYAILFFASRFLDHYVQAVVSFSTSEATHYSLLHRDIYLPKKTFLLVISSIFTAVICLPSSLTFSLLAKAAAIKAVASTYSGPNTHAQRQAASGRWTTWFKLLQMHLRELMTYTALTFVFCICMVMLTTFCFAPMHSRTGITWLMIGVTGVPYCITLANITILYNLANVFTVLEVDCSGYLAFVKAKNLLQGRRHTALMMALVSKIILKVVESIFECRLHRGIGICEFLLLVSMYSSVLAMETTMNAVFYFSCKPQPSELI
ncbi:uncharacterized protein LOC116256110 [Nymphaea colorata]|uniref:uncharacterized protein LOC116256110 n=1 Tax=Nymphaea colorata TaxID=210225 RepID=UPI00129E901F|nr:uncharacterized protein LOC116256110 [Nymphaea colorata]